MTGPMASVLCVIPARGGSKGIPRKNVRLLAGKPLIAYSIEAALSARTSLTTVVSTDDEEIAEVARQHGASVIERPAELARDDSPIEPVLLHAIAKSSGGFERILLLQPTAPARSGADIDAALELLAGSGADTVVSVVDVGHNHPARMYRIHENLMMPLQPEPIGRRRQDLPAVYIRNGAIYACRRELLERSGRLIGDKVVPYIMPAERSLNIDTPDDLEFAEWRLSRVRANSC